MIKKMLKKHIPDIALIDPNIKSLDLKKFLTGMSAHGIVCYDGDHIVGYATYVVYKKHYLIVRFYVQEDYRRNSHGAVMMAYLGEKLTEARPELRFDVSEYDTDLHLFLKYMGFTAQVSKKDDSIYTFTYQSSKAITK